MISIWLERLDTKEIINLTSNKYCLLKSDFYMDYNFLYKKISDESYIYTEDINLLNEKLFYVTLIVNLSDWSFVRDFLNRKKREFKLYYKDDSNDLESYCYVNLDYIFDHKKYMDHVFVKFNLNRNSNWITLSKFSNNDSINAENEDKPKVYPYKYAFDYPRMERSKDYNIVEVYNNGHEDCYFNILIENGGTNIEWELLTTDGVIESGLLNGDYNGRLEIKSSNRDRDILFKNQSVIQNRDYTKNNFFKIPIGKSILNLKNLRDLNYIVELEVERYVLW